MTTARRNARIDRSLWSRATTTRRGGRQTKGGEGGVLPSSWQTLVRGGGRLGWLEGVPFQTLRIDLFVDGAPSLHPLLVVVDHVLKLFQQSLSFLSAAPFRATTRQLVNAFDRIDGGMEEGRGERRKRKGSAEMYNGRAPRGEYGRINRMIISLAVVLSGRVLGISFPGTSDERSREIESSLLWDNHVNKIRMIFPIFMPFA